MIVSRKGRILLLSLIALLVATIAFGVWRLPIPDTAYESLDVQDMQSLRGAENGTCRSCGPDPRRLDECAHFNVADECRDDQCIANYLVEDTCVPAYEDQDCDCELNINVDWLIQYRRVNPGCSTINPDTWMLWIKHYYGDKAPCSERWIWVRCQKTLNTCNGTLIEFESLGPGIWDEERDIDDDD